MNQLSEKRKSSGFSQRILARKAGISFRCLQQLESNRHNWRVESLRRVGRALHLPDCGLDYFCARYLAIVPSSVEAISLRIHHDGPGSWKIHLFDFVDRFRTDRATSLIERPPVEELDTPLRALLASTVEMLCAEIGITTPDWCRSIPRLNHPWFVSGMENLKAMSLVESPAAYRARNIFVLANFLDRA